MDRIPRNSADRESFASYRRRVGAFSHRRRTSPSPDDRRPRLDFEFDSRRDRRRDRSRSSHVRRLRRRLHRDSRDRSPDFSRRDRRSDSRGRRDRSADRSRRYRRSDSRQRAARDDARRELRRRQIDRDDSRGSSFEVLRTCKSPGFPDSASAKRFERIKERILGELTPEFFQGPSPGPLTKANCAVFLEQHIRSMLQMVEAGVMRLEPDVRVDGRWITVPDCHTPRRIELLSECIQDHLHVQRAIYSKNAMKVWSISGQRYMKARSEVTCTDWLRLLVREHALTLGSTELAQAALASVSRQSNEACAAAAHRVVMVFRAAFATADYPYTSESQFFWRFVSEGDMRALFNRVTEVLMPDPFDRDGVSPFLMEHTQRLSKTMRKFHVDWQDPNGEAMTARGLETHQLFEMLVSVLSDITGRRELRALAAQNVVRKHLAADSMFSLQELSEVLASRQSLVAFINAQTQARRSQRA